MDKLIIPTLKSTVLGVVLLGLLLFLPAWAVIAIFVLGSNAIGIYLSVHDPELLERRKQAGPQAETRPAQKIIILILILIGALPTWGYSSGWGYGPGGIVGVILIIIVILVPTGQTLTFNGGLTVPPKLLATR